MSMGRKIVEKTIDLHNGMEVNWIRGKYVWKLSGSGMTEIFNTNSLN